MTLFFLLFMWLSTPIILKWCGPLPIAPLSSVVEPHFSQMQRDLCNLRMWETIASQCMPGLPNLWSKAQMAGKLRKESSLTQTFQGDSRCGTADAGPGGIAGGDGAVSFGWQTRGPRGNIPGGASKTELNGGGPCTLQ